MMKSHEELLHIVVCWSHLRGTLKINLHHCTSDWKISLRVEICHINGLVQDWNISISNALEILKSCFKQSIHSQYIAVTYSTILYDTEGGKLHLCSDNKLTNSVAVRYKKSISIIETVISIDYRYIDFLASYFSDRSRGIYRVGDNWRTVNTSANPHISDQLTELRTEYTC